VTLRAARRRDRLHRWVWALIDAAVWFAAVFGATWVRYDFHPVPAMTLSTLLFASVAAVGLVIVGALVGPYRVGHQRGSFEEIVYIARADVLTTAGLFVWALLTDPVVVPRSVPMITGAFALAAMFASRFLIRNWRSRRAGSSTHARRVIVFGAGDAGRRLVRNMVRSEESGFFPVALLDDDP